MSLIERIKAKPQLRPLLLWSLFVLAVCGVLWAVTLWSHPQVRWRLSDVLQDYNKVGGGSEIGLDGHGGRIAVASQSMTTLDGSDEADTMTALSLHPSQAASWFYIGPNQLHLPAQGYVEVTIALNSDTDGNLIVSWLKPEDVLKQKGIYQYAVEIRQELTNQLVTNRSAHFPVSIIGGHGLRIVADCKGVVNISEVLVSDVTRLRQWRRSR